MRNLFSRFFYRKSPDYYATIRRLSQGLLNRPDRQRVYEFTGDTLISTLGLRTLYVFSREKSGEFRCAFFRDSVDDRNNIRETSAEVNISPESWLVRLIEISHEVILADRLAGFESQTGTDALNEIKEMFNSFKGSAAVPVFLDNRLTHILILGERGAGGKYSYDDIQLLKTIASQMAFAISYATVHESRADSEKFASMGMMSAMLAHEIRNPLTSLKTFAQLMPEKYHDEDFRNTFSKIVLGDIERINGLIEDLLDVSSGKKSPGTDCINVRDLLDDMITYIKNKMELERRNIRIEKRYSDFRANISGNPKRLQHAFINILNNGCQAMNGNGVLMIDVVPGDDNVDIAIADNGHGIQSEFLNSIYEPFVTTREMGMGLGLTISKKIIEDHGGRISVSSRVSEGTVFTVSLPISATD